MTVRHTSYTIAISVILYRDKKQMVISPAQEPRRFGNGGSSTEASVLPCCPVVRPCSPVHVFMEAREKQNYTTRTAAKFW